MTHAANLVGAGFVGRVSATGCSVDGRRATFPRFTPLLPPMPSKPHDKDHCGPTWQAESIRTVPACGRLCVSLPKNAASPPMVPQAQTGHCRCRTPCAAEIAQAEPLVVMPRCAHSSGVCRCTCVSHGQQHVGLHTKARYAGASGGGYRVTTCMTTKQQQHRHATAMAPTAPSVIAYSTKPQKPCAASVSADTEPTRAMLQSQQGTRESAAQGQPGVSAATISSMLDILPPFYRLPSLRDRLGASHVLHVLFHTESLPRNY